MQIVCFDGLKNCSEIAFHVQLPLTHSVAAIQYQECLSGRRQVSNDRSLQLKVKVHFCRNEKVHFVEMSKPCYYELPAAGVRSPKVSWNNLLN